MSSSTTCTLCSSIYGTGCTSCNSNRCTVCTTGYNFNNSLSTSFLISQLLTLASNAPRFPTAKPAMLVHCALLVFHQTFWIILIVFFSFNQANYACVSCSIILGCNTCNNGPTCATCLAGYVMISSVCTSCASLYNTGCTACNQMKCTGLAAGYVFNTSTCIFGFIFSLNASYPVFNHPTMHIMH